MTPALVKLLMQTYSDIWATEAQYIYYAAGGGFNGLPKGCNNFTEWMGVVSRCEDKDKMAKMTCEEVNVIFARKNQFGKWHTNGFDGDADTPQNNAKIIEFALKYYERIFRFFNNNPDGLAKIDAAKKFLDEDTITLLNERMEQECLKY